MQHDMDVVAMLSRLEAKIDALTSQRAVKEWYTIPEAAKQLNKSAYHLRSNCRDGRILARKKPYPGRGGKPEWLISHDELIRTQCEGLRPPIVKI
jgi:hypothetical protein